MNQIEHSETSVNIILDINYVCSVPIVYNIVEKPAFDLRNYLIFI